MLPNHKTLKIFATLARQALQIARGSLGPTVWFAEQGNVFTITASDGRSWIEYRQPGAFGFLRCSLPWTGIVELAGAKAKDMRIEMEHNQNRAEWSEDGVPHVRHYDDDPSVDPLPFPRTDRTVRVGDGLLAALCAGLLTSARESTRYALSCLSLRGGKQDLAATDSLQILIQRGFAWPWEDDVLIPASRVFRSRDLQQAVQAGPERVGRSEKHVVLRFGPWWIALPIVTGSRFPDVDSAIPHESTITSRLTLAETDRQFLADTLPQLATGDDESVTLDLNGTVAIRTAGTPQTPGTELILSGSCRAGDPFAVNMNRKYLQRAAAFDIPAIEIPAADVGIVGRNDRLTYVWARLYGDPLPTNPHVQQLRSPAPAAGAQPFPPQPRKRQPMKAARPNPSTNGDANETDPVDQLIQNAEALKVKLKDVQQELQTLVGGLKSHKKQAKLVRSTLESLQKLKALQV